MTIRHLAKVAAATALLGATATAQAKEGATLRFEFPLLDYTSVNGKAKPDEGDDVTTKSNELETGDVDGIEVRGSYKSFNLYLLPFGVDGDASVRGGFMVNKQLEIGATIGLNQSKDEEGDDSDESTANSFGVFGMYYAPVSAALGIEAGLLIEQQTTKSKQVRTTTTGAETETNTESTQLGIIAAAFAVVPIAANFDYVGGLSIVMVKHEDKENSIKTDATGFKIQLAAVRYTLD